MKKRIPALLLTAALALTAAGCSGGGETQTSTPPADTSGAPSASGNTATAPDNDLVIAFNTDIQSMDPHNTTDTLSITVSRTMYESLVTFDENQEIVPLLAESYVAEDDNLTYTFKLREGVKFHDGSDFNADAVIANYERCLADTTLRQNSRVAKWESCTKVDEYTVAIKLMEPNSSFINQFTQFQIISPKALEEGLDLSKNAAGTGQYTFKEHTEGDHVTVVPFADYWGTKATVDSLTFRAVPEDGSRVAMLQTGEADYIYPMPTVQADQVNGTDNITVGAVASNIMRYVTLNTNLPELSDKRVRQAMNYAIDKEAYAQVVFSGYCEEVLSCYPSTVSYYSAQTPYTFDLEKAKSLMEEAGYGDGFSLTLWGDNISAEQTGMQFVMQQLAQIGITVEVLPMEPSTLSDMIYVDEDEAEINMWYVNWSASSFDADGSMRSILHSEMVPPKSANTAYFRNSEFDSLLDEAIRTSDPDKLADLYAQAQAIAWDEAPWLFLGNDELVYGAKTYVSGIVLNPDGSVDVTNATLA